MQTSGAETELPIQGIQMRSFAATHSCCSVTPGPSHPSWVIFTLHASAGTQAALENDSMERLLVALQSLRKHLQFLEKTDGCGGPAVCGSPLLPQLHLDFWAPRVGCEVWLIYNPPPRFKGKNSLVIRVLFKSQSSANIITNCISGTSGAFSFCTSSTWSPSQHSRA